MTDTLFKAGIPFWLVRSPAYISADMTILKVMSITFATDIIMDNYTEGGEFPKPFEVLAKCPGGDQCHQAVHFAYTPHLDGKPNPKAPQGQPSSAGKAPVHTEKKHHLPCE
jgi:hypothetical protein